MEFQNHYSAPMLRVGITGGIGSGKTTVATIFQRLGIPVFFSDIEAAQILSKDNLTQQKIINEFGKEIISDGEIDRKKLAEIVFSSPAKLASLNSIIHPAVRAHFSDWEKKQENVPYLIQEAAILIETGNYKSLDFIILISAPESLRIKRVMQRNHISKAEVKDRMKNQWSDAKKRKFSDFIIVNDEKIMLLPQVLKIHDQLLHF